MAYIINNGTVGAQRISDTSTVQNHPFGYIVGATDPTLGAGEFIYLKGVASTVVGSWVTYNADDWTSTLIVPNAIGPVAVAMSINDAATKFGWYQIQGKASAFAADVADNAKVYIDTVAGKCDDAVVAGDKVHGAKWASAEDTATNLAEVELSYPFCTDEST
jgi:hypothetical protein